MADIDKVPVRAGDTKQYVDTLTDTATGEPITADLTDGWEALCQIRANYATTSAVVASFTADITAANEVTRTLYEDQSTLLDAVPFVDAPSIGKRTVYWDAQLRLPDGLGAGKDYVVTYRSGKIEILGQVSRDA